jgi:hypothetical protein
METVCMYALAGTNLPKQGLGARSCKIKRAGSAAAVGVVRKRKKDPRKAVRTTEERAIHHC